MIPQEYVLKVGEVFYDPLNKSLHRIKTITTLQHLICDVWALPPEGVGLAGYSWQGTAASGVLFFEGDFRRDMVGPVEKVSVTTVDDTYNISQR